MNGAIKKLLGSVAMAVVVAAVVAAVVLPAVNSVQAAACASPDVCGYSQAGYACLYVHYYDCHGVQHCLGPYPTWCQATSVKGSLQSLGYVAWITTSYSD